MTAQEAEALLATGRTIIVHFRPTTYHHRGHYHGRLVRIDGQHAIVRPARHMTEVAYPLAAVTLARGPTARFNKLAY